jgi:TPP-dependent pyruvate/acetoin dehydrogenase alpha subunit
MSNSIISSLHSFASPNQLKPSNKSSSSLAKADSAQESAEDKFKAYAKMSPADRMRASMLSSMGITEEQLKNMSPDQQKAIEQKIAEQLKQAAQKQLEKSPGAGGFFTDIQA